MSDQHMKFLEYLQIEELPERYQEVALAIGVEAMVKLALAFPGVPIYLKKADSILFPAKRAYVLDKFTGANHRRLALETGLSLSTVYDLLKAGCEEKQGWKQETLI
jgi:Mor family transcriptional regulator